MRHYKEFQNDSFSFNWLSVKRRKDVEILYMDIPAAFDTETTSLMDDGEKVGLMYLWILGIGDNKHIYYGRKMKELKEFFGMIKEKFALEVNRRMIVYVHNLAFDFQFICKELQWENVFATDMRKPIKASTVDGIEFRDSYILAASNLATVAKNLTEHKIKKLVGDLDYDKPRIPKTPLTDKEMEYANNDVEILIYYIMEQIKQYGDITKIPLTNTGRVRKFLREICFNKQNKRNTYRTMSRLRINGNKEYYYMKMAYMGGFTHANIYKANKILEDITSMDFTSSYPAVLLAENYPMSTGEFVEFNDKDLLTDTLANFLSILLIKLTGVKPKFEYDFYISESKCLEISEDKVVNNGRVVSCESCTLIVTNIDVEIIRKNYNLSSITFINGYRYLQGRLPRPIIEGILQLYENKTLLKDLPEMKKEYMISKFMLNSVYGCMCTDIVRLEKTYKNKEGWTQEEKTKEEYKKFVDEEIEKYNKSYYRYLFYPWGIFCTAYARKNLWDGIFYLGADYVYSDTDSVKFLNHEKHTAYFEKYNKDVAAKMARMCAVYGFKENQVNPKTIKGRNVPLGAWDYDGHYDLFKTLGAKRYLCYNKDEGYSLTVAGLGKKAVDYIATLGNSPEEVFEGFTNGLSVPRDYTGKMTHYYIDTDHFFTAYDYLGNHEKVFVKSGIYLEKAEYGLGLSREFERLLSLVVDGYTLGGVTSED